MQDGNTRDMIFSVGDLLSRISRTLTLNPGDVVVTGTPEGVGYVRNPPWYLTPGDVVEVEVERLGTLRTPIVAATRTSVTGVRRDVDVLIVGGGPGGLVSAIELGRRGIAVLLVEPRLQPDPLRPRAKTTSVRTMEHLRRLGLAGTLRAVAPLPVAYAQDVIFCTGLFGHEITRFSGAFALTTERQEEFAESSQQVPQPLVEQVLRTFAAGLPSVELMIGARVTSLRDGDSAVAAEIVDRQGSPSAFITARYAIGADGAGGISRQAIGARYEGSSGALPNLNITFRSRSLDPERLCGRAVHYWIVGRSPAGIMGPLDLAGTWWTIVQGVADPASVDPRCAWCMTSAEHQSRSRCSRPIPGSARTLPWTATPAAESSSSVTPRTRLPGPDTVSTRAWVMP